MPQVIKKHVHPAQEAAAGLVQSSPYVIADVPLHRPSHSTTSTLSNFM